jgi:hypothetical protein
MREKGVMRRSRGIACDGFRDWVQALRACEKIAPLSSSSFSFLSRAREKKRKKKGQSRREGEDKSRQKDIPLSLGLFPFSLFLIHFFPKREEEEDTGKVENRGHGEGIGETTLREM